MNRKLPLFQLAIDDIVARLLSEYLVKPSATQFWLDVLEKYSAQVQVIIKEHEAGVIPTLSQSDQVAYREAMSQTQAQGLNRLRAEILYIRGGSLEFKTS